MQKIDLEILKIIHTHRNKLPVGTPTIDRILLMEYENFILDGKLPEKLKELTTKKLIQSPENQIGYSLTQEGVDRLKKQKIIHNEW